MKENLQAIFNGHTITSLKDKLNSDVFVRDMRVQAYIQRAGFITRKGYVSLNSYTTNKLKNKLNNDVDKMHFPQTIDISGGNADELEAETINPEAFDEKFTYGSAKFGKMKAKTFYEGNGWRISDAAKSVDPTLSPIPALRISYGRWHSFNVNLKAIAMLKNLIYVDDIVINKAKAQKTFPEVMAELEERRGEYFYNTDHNILVMNSVTLRKLRAKADSNIVYIKDSAIYNTFTKGVEYSVGNTIPEWAYAGVVPIQVDDQVPSEQVFALRRNCINYAFRSSLGYDDEGRPLKKVDMDKLKENAKIGATRIYYQAQYTLHPEGFDFIGEQGDHYTDYYNVTPAEFAGATKAFYKLAWKPEESLIYILNTGTL